MSTPQVGEVFAYKFDSQPKTYYKITKFTNTTAFGNINIPMCIVIRCSKTGKEFLQHNSFAVSFVEKQERWMGVDEKASTSGKQTDIDKRRITFLEAEIKRHTEELEQLKRKLNES